jgi:drug/metabolite transporter (DMT)-like permease
MIWALLLGYIWFGDVPGLAVLLGSSVVMLAGYLAYRETGSAVKPA